MILICPVCGQKLYRENNRAFCGKGHSFDYAKSGYLNLLISQKSVHGDEKDMVKARTAFLSSGAYSFLREQLSELTADSGITADLGCGEGYYTSRLKGREKYGFDMSKDALKHAARFDRTTSYVVSSIFRLPLPPESCDTALTCFAPAAWNEAGRILKPEGKFIYVSPGPDHLMEMKQVLYDKPYRNPAEEPDTPMHKTEEFTIRQSFDAGGDVLADLFKMTPYYYRTSEADKARLLQAGQLHITAEFIIRIYRKSLPDFL